MEYKRVNNDVNGNPRYVFHYTEFLSESDNDYLPLNITPTFKVVDNLEKRYRLALAKSRKIGGRAYRGSEFGGGIVVQSYNINRTIEQINELKNK